MIGAILIFLATVQRSPYRVGGDVKPPVAIKTVEVDYSRCIGKRASGVTIVETVIDKSGQPRNIRIVKPGMQCTTDAAVKALQQWTFRPGTLNGKPVDVIFDFTIIPHVR
jgi:TonB family protein